MSQGGDNYRQKIDLFTLFIYLLDALLLKTGNVPMCSIHLNILLFLDEPDDWHPQWVIRAQPVMNESIWLTRYVIHHHEKSFKLKDQTARREIRLQLMTRP